MFKVHLFISGRVQKVGFRFLTKIKAKELGLSGWVRNLPDGRVETIIVGDKEKVNEMVKWLHQGSPLARVDKVEIENRKIVNKNPFGGNFTIRRVN